MSALTPRRRLLSTGAVIGTAAVFGLTYGLSAPLIAVDMAERGAQEWYIGLNAAMHALGVLLIAPLLPKLAAAAGTRCLMAVALAIAAVTLAAFPMMPGVLLWFPLRLVLGMASEVILVLSETWTNDLADETTRGRTMAVYIAAQSAGFAGGPIIVALAGSEPFTYVIGAALALAAIAPIAWPRIAPPAPLAHTRTPARLYLTMAPLAIATTVLNSAVETAGLSFMPLYASHQGWGEQQGMQLIATLLVGAIVLQLPIGWLADKMNPRTLVLALSVISAASAFAWPWMFSSPALTYAVVFVWGGLFVGIYTVMLAIVGARFSGSDLVGIYAVMGSAWGVGALIGPTSVGFAMQVSPLYGLPFAVGIACALFAVYAFARKGA
jgi:MFS family permease